MRADARTFGHIKQHYYMSHRSVNPTGIVPVGPAIDFDAPVDGLRASAWSKA